MSAPMFPVSLAFDKVGPWRDSILEAAALLNLRVDHLDAEAFVIVLPDRETTIRFAEMLTAPELPIQ